MKGLKSRPEIAEGAELLSRSSNDLTDRIIAAAIEVHRYLGPGLLESVYEECLCYELSRIGIPFRRQVPLPVNYKGLHLACAYKMDLLVQDLVIIEIKAVDELLPIHKAQLLTHLKASGLSVGLLINFNVPILKYGLKRLVNHYTGPAVAKRDSAPSARESEEQKAPDNSPKTPRDLRVLRVSAVNETPSLEETP